MALAVALASLAAYVAVENRLRGDVNSSLRAQARDINGRMGGGFGDRFGGPGRHGEAPVYAQLVGADGTTSQPTGGRGGAAGGRAGARGGRGLAGARSSPTRRCRARTCGC